jgi:hypothetical protein
MIRNAPLKWLEEEKFPPGLEYTKSFEILIDDYPGSFPYDNDEPELYASYITGMIERMPNLRPFRYANLHTLISAARSKY